MAIKIFDKFSPRANPADSNYPYGSIKNESVPGAKDGTPLDAVWGNDYAGFDAALLAEAGIVPSGNPDTAVNSQRLEAIKKIAGRREVTYLGLSTGSFKSGDKLIISDRGYVKADVSSSGIVNDSTVLSVNGGLKAKLITSDGKLYASNVGINNSQLDSVARANAATELLSVLGGELVFDVDCTFYGEQATLGNLSRLSDGVTIKSYVTYSAIGGAAITLADNCCMSFDTRLRSAVTKATAPKNLAFKDMTFKQAPITFFEQQSSIKLEGFDNCVIDNCKFIGFSGDAITVGALTNSSLDAWLPTSCTGLHIINCEIDGVNLDNRNGISLVSVDGAYIHHNKFKDITRSDMPGAIDIEPEIPEHVIRDIFIHDNSFQNIGGSVGCIAVSTTAVLNAPVTNIHIHDNSLVLCNTAYFWAGPAGISNLVLNTNYPRQVHFYNNDITQCKVPFNVVGVGDGSIDGNDFVETASVSGALLGFFSPTENRPVTNFSIKENTYRGWLRNSASPTSALITAYGVHDGLVMENNAYRGCGTTNAGSPVGYVVFSCVGDSLLSKGVSLQGDNHFANGLTYPALTAVTYYTTGVITHPKTWHCGRNTFSNIEDEFRLGNHLFNQVVVTGEYDNVISNSFNKSKLYTAATSMRDIPFGVTTVECNDITPLANAPALLTTYRVFLSSADQYKNYQIAKAQGASSKILTRHPDVATPTNWGSWFEYTGVNVGPN